jgi:hypothetical protein
LKACNFLKKILDFKPWEDEFKENKRAISKEKRGGG